MHFHWTNERVRTWARFGISVENKPNHMRAHTPKKNHAERIDSWSAISRWYILRFLVAVCAPSPPFASSFASFVCGCSVVRSFGEMPVLLLPTVLLLHCSHGNGMCGTRFCPAYTTSVLSLPSDKNVASLALCAWSASARALVAHMCGMWIRVCRVLMVVRSSVVWLVVDRVAVCRARNVRAARLWFASCSTNLWPNPIYVIAAHKRCARNANAKRNGVIAPCVFRQPHKIARTFEYNAHNNPCEHIMLECLGR